jgi:hypothetical protein
VKTKAIIFLIVVGALAAAAAVAPSSGTSTETVVTAASGGTFPRGTAYAGVTLQEWWLGTGVVISSDGSAAGDFEVTVKGKYRSQNVEFFLVGAAATGSRGSGSAQFSGTATLRGLPGVPTTTTPFRVTIGMSSLQLTIGTITLPTIRLGAGEAFIG